MNPITLDLIKFALGGGFALALLKWAMMPIIKAATEQLLWLCKDTLKKIIDILYEKEFQANAQARKNAEDALEESRNANTLLSGLTESVSKLNTMPELVYTLNETLGKMNTEMSEWRGALKQSGVLKI